MALASIEQMAIDLLPTELVVDNGLLNRFITQVYYTVQNSSGKSDVDVEIEAEYLPKERILIANYTAYMYLKKILSDNSVSVKTASGEISTLAFNRRVKKAKADVVESEFEYADTSASAGFKAKATELMKQCLMQLCGLARDLGWVLGICAEIENELDGDCDGCDIVVDFIYTPHC